MSQSGLMISQVNGVTVVDFADAAILDAAAAEHVAAELYRLVDEQRRQKIALDLGAVRFLASQMLGTLIRLHKKAGDVGGKVVLCGLAENLYRVFEVSRLDAALHFAPSLAAGIAALERGDAEAPAGARAANAAQETRWRRAVNRQIGIFFAGAVVLVPLAITVWLIWSVGTWLDSLGRAGFEALGVAFKPPPGIGALVLIGVIYVVGLLTRLWLFRGLFGLLEGLLTRLPGVKTIYESVRDLMKLFGGESRRMGRVVQYNVPDSDVSFLGVLTNENPLGLPKDDPKRKVSVYMPLSYMIGGPTLLVSPEHVVEVDMSVEQCMKLCATAQVGAKPLVAPPAGGRAPHDSSQASGRKK
jgi:anti-anti-sigma factor